MLEKANRLPLGGALFLLPLLAALGCADEPTAPGAAADERTAPPARTLGLVEITLTGLGTEGEVQTSALAAPDAGSLAALRGARTGTRSGSGLSPQTLTPPDFVAGGSNGTIQLEPVSAGSFTDGERGSGGVRYVWASYRVRNAQADGTPYDTERQNLTFLAVDTDGTLGETAVSGLTLFNGAPAGAALAEQLIPTGQIHRDGNGVLVSTGPDVLQALTEAEAAAIVPPARVTDVFPYGFIVRSPGVTPGERSLPASPAGDQYDGVVTFAFKLPLQATAADDAFTIRVVVLAVDDSETRITESPSEQAVGGAALQARADALTGASVTLLGNTATVIAGHAVQRICTVRTAGSDPNAPAATLVDVIGCDVLSANVRLVDVDAAPGGDGAAWTTAFNTLQDALGCVRTQSGTGQSCEGVDELWVAEGVYYPDESAGGDTDDASAAFALIDGVALYGGFAGSEVQRDQRDAETRVTILSGDIAQDDLNGDGNAIAETATDIVGTNSGQVVNADGRVTPITRNTVVDGFTITAGQASGLICRGGGAGAECSPTLRNVAFSGNLSNAGGALNGEALDGGTVAPLFEDVTFAGNASNSVGGAVRILSTNGGAVSPVFVRATFRDNTAVHEGGAIYLDGDGAGLAALYNTVFEGNESTVIDFDGGAIAISGLAAEIVNTVFRDNRTTGNGGALYLGAGAGATLINITLAANRADSDDNDTSEGGGIYVAAAATVTLHNGIVWGNSDGLPSSITLAGTGTANHAIIEGGCPAGLTCTAVNAGDPLFVDAPGGDLRLQGTSPALDAGDNALLPADAGDVDGDTNVAETLPFDLDGLARIIDWMADDASATVDLGAYEKQ